MNNRKILANLDLIIAAIAFVVLVVVTFGGVIMRYILGNPLIWSEEVQLWCFLWMTFFGAGAAFRYGSHVAVEIIYERLSESLKKKVTIINYIITMAILAYVCVLGGDLLALMLKIGKTTSILRVPYWFINAVIPLGAVIMMVSVTYATFFKKEVKVQEA